MKVNYLQQITYRHLPSNFRDRYAESVVTNPYWELVDPDRMSAAFRDGLDEMMHAARAGFDGVGVTEHAQANYDVSPNPDLIASAFAYATETERLEVAVNVLGRTLGKTREPLRVAEEYAVIDHISGGRLVAGFPLGLAYDAGFNNGVPPIESRARFDENLALILAAWTKHGAFPWNGKYSQYPNVNIWPRPLQSPNPPIVLTSVGTPRTARLALERDFGLNFVGFSGDPLDAAKPAFDALWRAAAEMGKDDNPYRASFAQFAAVADSDAEAERLYKPHVEYCFGNGIGHIPMNRLMMPGGVPKEGVRAMLAASAPSRGDAPTYKELVSTGAVVVGRHDTVAERLELLAKTFRIGNLSLFMQIGSMPKELTKHNIDLFASSVLPRLQSQWSEYDTDNRWWPVRLGGRPASPNQIEAGAVR